MFVAEFGIDGSLQMRAVQVLDGHFIPIETHNTSTTNGPFGWLHSRPATGYRTEVPWSYPPVFGAVGVNAALL